jgi:hypothetical protein
LSSARSNAMKQVFENFDLASGHDGRLSAYDWRSNLLNAERCDQLLEKLREVHGCSRYDFPSRLMKHFDLAKFIREKIRT